MLNSKSCLFLFLIFIVFNSSFAAEKEKAEKPPAEKAEKPQAEKAEKPANDEAVYKSFVQCLNEANAKDKMEDLIITKTSKEYTTDLDNYIRNARVKRPTIPKPTLILRPKQVPHIQAFVTCTKKVGYQLKIRSGGHDYEGISSYSSTGPFFLLDMSNFRAVNIDLKEKTAWVEVGATLGETYFQISEKSKTLGYPAGVCPTVGAGGHISGGGYGAMLRKYGLTVDNLLDASMVDVNGKILDKKSMGDDLWWAIRGGGGGSYGVIVSFKISLVPVPETVTVFRIIKLLEEDKAVEDIMLKYLTVAPATDPSLFMRLMLQPVTSKANPAGKTIRMTIIALYLGKADALLALLSKELPELKLKKEDCHETTWINSVMFFDNQPINGTVKPADVLLNRELNTAIFLKRKSDYLLAPLPKPDLIKLFETMKPGKAGMVFNPYGGKMAEISPTAVPFPHRKGNLFKIQYMVNWEDPALDLEKKYLGEVKALYDYMTPFVSKNPRRAFMNYRDLDIGVQDGKNPYEEGKKYGIPYWGENFERLVKVKTVVDPENFFRHQQSIPPGPKKA